jgi:hypothetical protein
MTDKTLDLFREASKWSTETGHAMPEQIGSLLGWLTSAVNVHIEALASSPEQAEPVADKTGTGFIEKTNREYIAWCKSHYIPESLDEDGRRSLDGLWAWQEQERRYATQPAAPVGLTLENAPLGTKAPAIIGGHWVKVTTGWKWHMGDTFPRPGGDWTGELIAPTAPAPGSVRTINLDQITPEMEKAFQVAFIDQIHNRKHNQGRKPQVSAEVAGLRAMLAAAPAPATDAGDAT